MKNVLLLTVCCVIAASAQARSTPYKLLHFDLSTIGMVVDGQQICEDKGRLQDVSSDTMEHITGAGPGAPPVLIAMLTDPRIARTKEPIICFWPGMAIGDIAFCLMSDLFTDASGKATLPGSGWNALLGPSGNLPGWEQLHRYIKKHGRKDIQAKWQELWKRNADRIYWSSTDRCFKIKAG